MKYFLVFLLAIVLFISGIYHKEIVGYFLPLISEGESDGGNNSPTISFEKIKELNTVEAKFSDAVLYKKTGLQGEVHISGYTYDILITIADVKVKAGIDMSKIDLLSPQESKELIIKLPSSKITSVEFSPPTHETIKRHGFGNVAGEPAVAEVNRIKNMARSEISKMAKSAGILTAATANAKEAIRNYVEFFGNNYTVVFK